MKRYNHGTAFMLFLIVGLMTIGLMGVNALFTGLYGRGLFQKNIYGVDVSGVVLDGDTHKPIPNVEVQIRVVTAEFYKRSPVMFSVVADQSGKFAIKKKISRPLMNRIGISAESNDQKTIRTSVNKLMRIAEDEIPTTGEYMFVTNIKLNLFDASLWP